MPFDNASDWLCRLTLECSCVALDRFKSVSVKHNFHSVILESDLKDWYYKCVCLITKCSAPEGFPTFTTSACPSILSVDDRSPISTGSGQLIPVVKNSANTVTCSKYEVCHSSQLMTQEQTLVHASVRQVGQHHGCLIGSVQAL